MNLDKTALVLEGGGFRGLYTSGALQLIMEKNLYFPYVIGVSMGACNAANYVSKQIERNRIVNTRFVRDKRYISYKRLITKGELFGMDFLFRTIPNSIIPFDWKTFYENPQKLYTTVTDCHTGEAVYFEKSELGADDYMTILQASSSLPLVAKPVIYKGRTFMDGGMADSVPVQKSIADGNRKQVIILTQPAGYRKTKQKGLGLIRKIYAPYKGFCEALERRHIQYNETADLIERLEAEGKAFVLRPSQKIQAARIERDQKKLFAAYDSGYREMAQQYERLEAFLKS